LANKEKQKERKRQNRIRKIEKLKESQEKVRIRDEKSPSKLSQSTKVLENSPFIEIYTDGSSYPKNPGFGGYASIIKVDGKQFALMGNTEKSTSNQMELAAIITSLDFIQTPSNILVYSDSTYCVNSIMKGWAVAWRNSNWNNYTRKNWQLFDALLDLCENRHNVVLKWVSRNTLPEQAQADKLAGIQSYNRSLM